MGDSDLAGRIPTADDGIVDGSPDKVGDPDIHLSVSSIPTVLAETLGALAARFICHIDHP